MRPAEDHDSDRFRAFEEFRHDRRASLPLSRLVEGRRTILSPRIGRGEVPFVFQRP